VKYVGTVGTLTTYLSPADEDLKKTIWPQENIGFPGPCVRAEALAGAEVLATVTPPLVAPEAGYALGTHFAQIWSNPPATKPGSDPGIVENSFGKGKTIWVAAPIESRPEPAFANILLHFLRGLVPAPYRFEVDTDPAVETTLFDQAEQRRMLVSLLNMREQMPVSTVGATVRVRLPEGRKPARVLRVPDLKEVPFEISGAYVQFSAAPFKVAALHLVEYR